MRPFWMLQRIILFIFRRFILIPTLSIDVFLFWHVIQKQSFAAVRRYQNFSVISFKEMSKKNFDRSPIYHSTYFLTICFATESIPFLRMSKKRRNKVFSLLTTLNRLHVFMIWIKSTIWWITRATKHPTYPFQFGMCARQHQIWHANWAFERAFVVLENISISFVFERKWKQYWQKNWFQ